MNIEVIAIVVLGGTSVAGGTGSIRGTFVATLIVGRASPRPGPHGHER